MGKFIRKHIYLVFILPALIWIGIFTIYPFFYSFYISVTDLNLLRMGTEEIIGMKNYVELFQNKDFIHSCVVSLKFSAVVVVGQFTLGFALAFLFQKKRPYRENKRHTAVGRTAGGSWPYVEMDSKKRKNGAFECGINPARRQS